MRDSVRYQADEELDAIDIKHPTKNIDTLEFLGIVEVELIVKTVEDNFRLEIPQVNSPQFAAIQIPMCIKNKSW